jgi:hypothetical protein
MDFQMEALIVLAMAGLLIQLFQRQHQRMTKSRTVSAPDYLYKMARIAGASEYEIFRKSAENWPVSAAMVDEHFKGYLLNQATPCYVNAFVRKHKQQVDRLKLPPF